MFIFVFIKKVIDLKKKLFNILLISLTGIFLVFIVFLFPYFRAKINAAAGEELLWLDGRFSYDYQDVMLLMENLGVEGRIVYSYVSGVPDMYYPLVYGILFSLLILKLTIGSSAGYLRLLTAFPVLAVVFDYLENFGVQKMIDHYPHIQEADVYLNSLYTSMKWGFVFFTVLILIALSLAKLSRFLKTNSNCFR